MKYSYEETIAFNEGWEAALNSFSGARLQLAARTTELMNAALGVSSGDSKRLTDTELAAEYWRALFEVRDAETDWFTNKIRLEDLHPVYERFSVMSRFANTPHAFEKRS